MSKTRNGSAVREEKRQAAHARQQLRNALTPAQQLAVLDDRLGVGTGAKRERARLEALINTKKGE